MAEKNPFAPETERVPLLLTLDARSLEMLTGERREEAEYLCELCWTDAIDGLWSWEGEPIGEGIRQTKLGPIEENDSRTVGEVGYPWSIFFGGVSCWSQFDGLADQYGYKGAERDWFIYYAALSHFHRGSNRHYIVTADDRLLAECSGKGGFFRKGQHRVTSVSDALFLAGLVMKAHGKVSYESPQPTHTIHTSSYSMYDYLARDLIASRPRIFEAMKEDGKPKEDFYRSEREALCVSIFDRVSDLLRARDHIALTNSQYEEQGQLGEILYDLRATVGNATGLFDTVAVLAHRAFAVQVERDTEISLHHSNYRKALRAAKIATLAGEAERQCPLFAFLWSLRNPILHQGGLSGFILHTLGVGQSYRAALTQEQADKLKSLTGHRREDPKAWGLGDPFPGLEPSADPMAFSHRLTVVTVEVVDRLLSALADDRGTPDLKTSWTDEERRAIRRFRWLTGLGDSH